jgi:hypothetical protein
MRYEKPIVMDLGSRARRAKGQGPLACINGDAAGANWESCGTGTGAGWGCYVGIAPGDYPPCVSGSAADGGQDCFGGTQVSFLCGAGTSGGTDLAGCNVGPAVFS